MGIAIGGGKLKRAMLGTQKIKAIMLGNQKIWSGMGQKWIYTLLGGYFSDGYITRIDPDTMATVDIKKFGDLSVIGGAPVRKDYDHHGNIFYQGKNKDENNSWVYYMVRMNAAGAVANKPAMGFMSMDKDSLEIFGYYRENSTRRSYLEIYGTNDYGNSYFLKARLPAVLNASGTNLYNHEVYGEVVSTKNHIYYFTTKPTYYEGQIESCEYRGVGRYNKNTLVHTVLVPNDSRGNKATDYMPLMPHPTRTDYFYSTNLTSSHYIHRSTWLQLRDPNGVEIAAIALPSTLGQIRATEDRLLAVCGSEILDIHRDLASYRVLVSNVPGGTYLFLDEEYYIRSSKDQVADASGALVGYAVEKFDYSGNRTGYGISVRGGTLLCSHPLLEP